MNPAEQTVTWLITLGVLESPKKTISDPEGFLQTSLKDGVVLCKLLERLRPGSVEKICQEPRNDSDCLSNIREFLKGCTSFRVETFEANDLFQGQNFTKVLNSLVALNSATADIGLGGDSVCGHHSSTHRIKSFESLSSQTSHGRSSRPPHNQYRSLDMSESGGPLVVVKARFNFQQTNEDELSFSKGDLITVSRQEEGGWWEGSLNGKTGWFPSNYVREVKGKDKSVSPKSGTLKSPPKGAEANAINKTYYNVVLQNILETEVEYSKELQSLLSTYLRPLQSAEKVSAVDTGHILGNIEDICTFQQILVQSLEECTRLPESQQRIGGFFLNQMPQMRSLYMAYCSNHPSAVSVLTEHGEVLGEFMESKGASPPGILTLTTGLSKPFTRLDKYPTLLKELHRHVEEHHPDHVDLQKSMSSFKALSSQCQEVRKRKELELQILSESIRNWEGDDIKSLGPVLYMSHVAILSTANEEKQERYLLLFPHLLLMLSASPRMSGFIYQGKMPLTGMAVNRLEDGELRNTFEISGSMVDRMQVVCNSPLDLQEWLEHLQRHTRHTSGSGKTQSVCHTLPSHPLTPSRHSENRGTIGSPAYHTLPHHSSLGATHGNSMWGPLEPPKTQKPWSLSCLRPAPPLRPSAALSYKEDVSKSPKSMRKLRLRKSERKPSDEEFSVRKSTAALEEDAQILKVIEAYCTSAKTRQTLNSRSRKESGPHMLFPEEEKIIVEETKSNGQTVVEERSLVDTVYALRDEVQELKQDNKRMKRTLEEEQRARKELEKAIRKVLKNSNDPTWDETNL
ncbi:rho guanine nucleotide exchange factor 7b [Engraulis encrasicolus]|uniref:rho guanine nucleotide exchange factor 7b n=1 Tax=Engraulis encrasicolus TaxID=184585 RepID=UPI002FD16CB3